MKRLLSALASVLATAFYLLSPLQAQFVAECRYGFCQAGDGTSVTPVSTSCISSSGSTITFTAQNIGGANPNRITIVTINWGDSTVAGTAELNSMTVGGISMTRAVRAAGDNQSSNAEIWYVANPTGTSANIVATFSTAVDGITIGVYNLVGYLTTPSVSTTGTTSVTQAYSNKQVAIAAASRRTNVSTSLSNMTNDFSAACGANLWGVHASQRLNGNNGTLTSTISPTTATPEIALAVWATTLDCTTPANTFLARTSGLNATHVNAYNALICGLVTDGVWSKLDVLYIYATQNSTTAALNLVSTSFNATVNGSPTFTTDRGYQGTEGSSTVYIDTSFNPSLSGHQYASNGDSAHISVWVTTNGQGTAATGGSDGSNAYPIPRFADDNFYCRINNAASGAETVANTDSRGHFIVNRSAHALSQGYKNGSLVVSPNNTNIFGPPNLNFYSLGWNNSGVPLGYGQQMAMISIGSSLSGTDATNIYNRLRTYMTAVGVP